MNDMNTSTVSFSRFTAAACAIVITAVSAWAFVSSSTSLGRDPFQFAAVMAANAKARTVQIQARNATPVCWSEFVTSKDSTANPIPVCRKG
jgi:hypothetical protein